MRQALLRELPAFTRFYGLKPADFDDMTLREISEYRTQMQKARADADAERRKGG